MYENTQTAPRRSFGFLTVIAVILLVVAVFAPFLGTWAGLFPEPGDAENIINDFKMLGEHPLNLLIYRPLTFRASALISSVLLLIGALCKKRGLAIMASVIGFALLIISIIALGAAAGFEEVFSVADGSVCYGTWLAVIGFIVAFIAAITQGKE